MTRALLLAVLAAVCAAGGIVELSAAGARTRPRPAQRRRRAAAGGAGAPGPAHGGAGRAARPGSPARRRGAPATVTVAEVMALKGGAAVAAFAAAPPLAALLPGRLGPVAVAIAPAGAFVAPDAWLAGRRGAGARDGGRAARGPRPAARRGGAGLPALRALGEVGRRRGGPLATELRAACASAALGVPHAQASSGSRAAARSPTSPPWWPPSGAASATVPRWRRRCARWPPTRAPSARSACATARRAPRPRSSSSWRCCSCPR